jgi:taurine dioxygenase
MFVSLYALEIPMRAGVALGDTRWASMVGAYDALPESIKTDLAGRKVSQSFAFHMDKLHRIGALTRPRDVTKVWPEPQVHPAVRTHPITGRKLLYVNESFSEHIEGFAPERSAALLPELWAHLTQPRFQFQHRWRKNDFVIWDNCATQHLATFDYGTLPRRLHRCGTDGPRPE